MKALASSFAVCLLAVCPAEAQTQLSQYRPGVTPEGAVYFLPKTVLRISVLVEKTTYQPGDFAPFAQRYLRMADVSQEPATSYRVVDIKQTPMPCANFFLAKLSIPISPYISSKHEYSSLSLLFYHSASF